MMERLRVVDLVSEMSREQVPSDDHPAITDAYSYAVRLTGDDDVALRSVAAAYAQMQDDLRSGRSRRRARACLMASVHRQHGAPFSRRYGLLTNASAS